MVKPENRFLQNLFSKLPKPLYFEKTHMLYRSGTPDVYLEGPNGILWCEVKWIEKPWAKDLDPSQVCKTKSWLAQRRWLVRAHQNNVQTCVIVGIGSGRTTKAYILEFPYAFSLETNQPLTLEEVRTYLVQKT